jgi:predicted HAD superfamily phosphohydrolase YqeG
MATVRASLSLNSADVLTSALALTTVANLNCDSGSLIRAKVKGTVADTDDLVVYKADDKNERAYLYIKNLEPELENYIYVRNETESNTALVAKIGGGEFAFIPLAPDKTYEAIATKVDSLIEFGVFGNDNSSVSLA